MAGNDELWVLVLGVSAALGFLAVAARYHQVRERRVVAARFDACKARIQERKRKLKEGR